MDRNNINSHKNEIVFFYKSPITVALLSFFTFNFYSLYWSYKHWKTVQDSKGDKQAYTRWWVWGGSVTKKQKTYPVFAAIFQLFSTYPLFKLIKNTAQESGYEKFRQVKLAAIGYIFVSFALYTALTSQPTDDGFKITAIVFAVIFTASIATVLSVVQRAANAHNIAVLGNTYEFKKLLVGEIVITILGVLFSILAIDLIITGTENHTPSRTPVILNSGASETYEKMIQLNSQYDVCSSNLEESRDSVDIYNDYEVDSFNNDLQECENTRLQLIQAIDEHNRLTGSE